jgi:hypothetical protein
MIDMKAAEFSGLGRLVRNSLKFTGKKGVLPGCF